MRGDDGGDLQQYVLFDHMVRLPKCGFGKGVDEEIEREIAEGGEVDDQCRFGIDLGMVYQHASDVIDNGGHLADVLISQAYGFLDPPMRHA